MKTTKLILMLFLSLSAYGQIAYNEYHALPVLTAPELLLPLNGAIDVSRTPLLDWSDVEGQGVTYQVQVTLFTDIFFTAPVINVKELQNSHYKVGTNNEILAPITMYLWRARAHDNSDWGPFSPVFTFTTIFQ